MLNIIISTLTLEIASSFVEHYLAFLHFPFKWDKINGWGGVIEVMAWYQTLYWNDPKYNLILKMYVIVQMPCTNTFIYEHGYPEQGTGEVSQLFFLFIFFMEDRPKTGMDQSQQSCSCERWGVESQSGYSGKETIVALWDRQLGFHPPLPPPPAPTDVALFHQLRPWQTQGFPKPSDISAQLIGNTEELAKKDAFYL